MGVTEDRIDLFRQNFLRMRLIIQRPQFSEKRYMPPKWYCSMCVVDNENNRRIAVDKKICEKEMLVRKAKQCSAVIRRIGMEWCSLSFHDEDSKKFEVKKKKIKQENRSNDHVENSKNHKIRSSHVSLRRLDLMMRSIIEKNEL